jgi:hypothetical protein
MITLTFIRNSPDLPSRRASNLFESISRYGAPQTTPYRGNRPLDHPRERVPGGDSPHPLQGVGGEAPGMLRMSGDRLRPCRRIAGQDDSGGRIPAQQILQVRDLPANDDDPRLHRFENGEWLPLANRRDEEHVNAAKKILRSVDLPHPDDRAARHVGREAAFQGSPQRPIPRDCQLPPSRDPFLQAIGQPDQELRILLGSQPPDETKPDTSARSIPCLPLPAAACGKLRDAVRNADRSHRRETGSYQPEAIPFRDRNDPVRQTAHPSLASDRSGAQSVLRLDHDRNSREAAAEGGDASAVGMQNVRPEAPRQQRESRHIGRVDRPTSCHPIHGHPSIDKGRKQWPPMTEGEIDLPAALHQFPGKPQHMPLGSRPRGTVQNHQDACRPAHE